MMPNFQSGGMNLNALGMRGGGGFQSPAQPPMWGGMPSQPSPMPPSVGPVPIAPPMWGGQPGMSGSFPQPHPIGFPQGGQPSMFGPMTGGIHPVGPEPVWGGQPPMNNPMPFQGERNPSQVNLGALGGQPSGDMMQFLRSYSQMRRPQMGSY